MKIWVKYLYKLLLYIAAMIFISSSMNAQDSAQTWDSLQNVEQRKLPWLRMQSPWVKDAGWWCGVEVGYQAREEKFNERMSFLLRYEYRIEGFASFPLEYQWWQWRRKWTGLEKDNKIENAWYLNGAFKLRVYIYYFNFYAQAGIGVASEGLIPISAHYAGGFEFSLKRNLRIMIESRRVTHEQSKYFYMLGVNIKNE
jgi:hypothetical protein